MYMKINFRKWYSQHTPPSPPSTKPALLIPQRRFPSGLVNKNKSIFPLHALTFLSITVSSLSMSSSLSSRVRRLSHVDKRNTGVF